MMNLSPSPSRINDGDFWGTSSTLAYVSSYIDTLEMFSKRRPDTILMSRLRDIQQRLVWFEPIIVRGTRWGYRLVVNQPRPEAISLIHNWAVEVGAVISRLHLAYDFDPGPHVTRECVIDWLLRNLHLRYRRQTDETIEVGGTYYCVRAVGRKARPSVNFVIYATRVGKLDGEVDKIHFEIRLENSRAIKSAKIEAPKDLIALDPKAPFDRYVKTGSTDQFIDRVIKRTIDQTRPTPYIDVDKRVRAIMMRTGCDTLTGIKQYYPRAFERMKKLDVLSISDRLEWVRPGVIDEVREDGGGENVVFVTRTSKTTSHPQRKSVLARKTTRRIRLNQPPKRARDGDDLARSPTPERHAPEKPPCTGHSAIEHHRKRGTRDVIRNRLTGGDDMGRFGTDRDDIEIYLTSAKPTEIETPRSRSRRSIEPNDRKAIDPRTAIKDAMRDDPSISARELKTKMERLGIKISLVTVSNIRAEHRHSLKFLISKGATHLQRLL